MSTLSSPGFGPGTPVVPNCAVNNGGCSESCYHNNLGTIQCGCNPGFVSTVWEAGCIGKMKTVLSNGMHSHQADIPLYTVMFSIDKIWMSVLSSTVAVLVDVPTQRGVSIVDVDQDSLRMNTTSAGVIMRLLLIYDI